MYAMKLNYMKIFRVLVLSVCVGLMALAPPANAGAGNEAAAETAARQMQPPLQGVPGRVANGYRLGAGDILTIRVYGEDDLTREKQRLPDSGVLSFPFGDVCALGLTVSDLENKITEVSVSIEEYRPFFIYGQVEKPGGYSFQSGLNVRKAVSIAGGFKERASQSKIYVVREGDAGNAANKVDLNSPVWPGDTVTVEESFF
jgi:polysaccharide export outer membrane protein